ncbi:NAD(P)H-dependent oxidoreductase [Acinetobacter haemolyticus]|uniref:NAD(P)H-dependent oxidoreductase n=1 Tax=Acinetobacter haemolyticus TaxID=29430 RepID=UPI0021CFD35D|nr:NAD(P)H-dependent oxidoreductase [Acinetobacter haemolyticus]MCU4386530.1 NAD(P)H-dependent oxidoreductase [Acinetobacter haemolyticus]
MNVLIVHAHPEKRSFTTAMKTTVQQTFEQLGHTVEVSDLYEIKFNPVASADDFIDFDETEYLNYALEQRNALKSNTLSPDIAVEIEKVKRTDLVIFTFPLNWTSVPAILKGWIDRVFVSGLFYGGKRFYNHGGMTGKKAMLCFSLGGRDHMFGENSVHGPIEQYLSSIQRGSLAYVGFEVIPPFIAYHVPYISNESRQDILTNLEQYLQNLDNLSPIEFPHLENFDEKMNPKT